MTIENETLKLSKDLKTEYSLEEVQKYIEEIEQLNHEELVRIYLFAPVGHPFLNREYPMLSRFEERLATFGGVTERIKKIVTAKVQSEIN